MIYYHGAPGWVLPRALTQKLHDLSISGRVPGEYTQFLSKDVGASQFLALPLLEADLRDFEADPELKVEKNERKGWCVHNTQGVNLAECTRIYQLYFATVQQGLPAPRAMYSVTDVLLVEPLIDMLGPQAVPYFGAEILGDPAFWTNNKELVNAFEHVPEEIQENHAVCEAVLRIDGRQLEYCSADLRGDQELVKIAMLQDPRSVKFATMELMSDECFVWDVLERHPELMRFVGHLYRDDLGAATMVTGASNKSMENPELLKYFSAEVQTKLGAEHGLELEPLDTPVLMGRPYKRQCQAN